MHGVLFAELKQFVVAKAGGEAWNQLCKEAGLEGKVFLPNQAYADGDLESLVVAGSKVTGIPVPQLQEAFGAYIAPQLLKLYGTQINPAWRTLDIVDHTESMVHRIVRIKMPGAQPPRLVTTRTDPNTVVMEYTSQRKMCAVAIGIIRGVGTHFKENIDVTESECMHKGAQRCLVTVRRKA